MTELYIDGVAVVLPKAMSLQVKRENPFFTKNGEYTYDLTLDLTNSVNAELYGHLYRLNSLQEIKSKRKAVLIADNRVYCNGTEIITGWTDSSVTIQIASGNSELNYFIGGDLMISFLDLGTAVIPADRQGKLKHVTSVWPEVNFCLPTTIDSGNEEVLNQWVAEKYKDNNVIKYRLAPTGELFFAQPYYCFIIREVCKAIGYSVDINQLEDSVFKDLFFSHAERTNNYAEMFPGWTVKELFESIEALSNVSFIVDNRNRTVRVLFNNSFYLGSKQQQISYVIDEYECEAEEKGEENSHTENNIRYDFPEGEYYSFARLSEGVLEKAVKKSFPNYQQLETYMLNTQNADRGRVLALNQSTGREYILHKPENQIWQLKEVNLFRDLIRDKAAGDISLEIIPVAFTMWMMKDIDAGTGSPLSISESKYVPYVPGSNSVKDEQENSNLNELVLENVSSDDSPSKNNLYVAFYQGFWTVHMSVLTHYPLAFTDCDGGDGYGVPGASLALAKLSPLYYEGVYSVNSKNGIKITSYDPNLYDTRNVCVINHKRYVCKEMEYVLTESGRKKAWTGTFYPIKISDTEAEQRWILTDGRWRDGGVFLDNGRWLDE